MFPVLRERLDDPAANLSGGQQQMLALGMAFLSRPKLLAIDELSLGLAPVIVEQLLPIVRRIADQGTTVILVEQSVNVALTLAEKAFFMEKGEIRFSGPTAELLERPDVLRSVFLEGAAKGMGDGEAADAHAAADDGTTDAPPLGAGTPEAKAAAAASVRERFGIPPDAPPALALDDLSVRFGGIRAVDGVTFSVAAGEIVGIIGPNGAGKTTLFDLISGFTSSDGGTVALYGHDVTGLSADARARGRARPQLPGRACSRRSRSRRRSPPPWTAGSTSRTRSTPPSGCRPSSTRRTSCSGGSISSSTCSASKRSAPSSCGSSRPARAGSSTWRACWGITRRSCCSTSPPAASPSARPRRSAR
ncbi:MAG: ATP-binding cassette domain-containing protein [Acidimicrobiales bacterium]